MASIKSFRFIATVAVLGGSTFGLLGAQSLTDKAIGFFGRVNSISTEKKMISVKHGKIGGYLESGITLHPVQDSSVLERLRVGDYIIATAYRNDLTLYRIVVVSRRSTGPPGNARAKAN